MYSCASPSGADRNGDESLASNSGYVCILTTMQKYAHSTFPDVHSSTFQGYKVPYTVCPCGWQCEGYWWFSEHLSTSVQSAWAENQWDPMRTIGNLVVWWLRLVLSTWCRRVWVQPVSVFFLSFPLFNLNALKFTQLYPIKWGGVSPHPSEGM